MGGGSRRRRVSWSALLVISLRETPSSFATRSSSCFSFSGSLTETGTLMMHLNETVYHADLSRAQFSLNRGPHGAV